MSGGAEQEGASGRTALQKALAETLAGEASPDSVLARGSTLGRYVVLELLGRGGAGVVYAAFDPELERRVAIKLLAPSAGGPAATSDAQARLVREAQALAQLSHPAVVAVHDVGVSSGGVWLAMELLAGQTLAEWLRARRRAWRAVLAVFLQAGAGLQAAHAAGLVHRDFKPHNVMFGADGRVRVTDFGLARADRRAGPAPRSDPTRSLSSSLGAELTQVGEVVGTPGYMAPEQWFGEDADPRADQFAFCVSLWEGLYGESPFAGDTVADRSLSVTTGRRRPVPSGTRVPGWLRRAVERGLAREPERRWPSMADLLIALEQGASRARRRLVAASAAALALALGAVAGARAAEHARVDAACRAQAASIGAAYNGSIRAEIEAALLATGARTAPAVARRIGPELDGRVGRWMATQYELCRARAREPTLPPELAAHAQACVSGVRWSIEGLLAALRTPDAATVGRALPAIAGLPQVERCTRPDALARRPALPADPAVREQIDALRSELGRAQSLGATGRARDAAERARPLVARADALGWPPLAAEVRLAAGELTFAVGDHAAAEALLRDGLNLAASAGEDALLAAAAADLAAVLGSGKARYDEAIHWARLAQALVGRPEAAADELEASVALRLAQLHRARSEYAEAERLYARAREIWEALHGPDHPDVAVALNNLATLAQARGDFEAARSAYTRAMAIWENRFGPDHPDVAAALNNLGILQAIRGRFGEAAAMFRRAADTFSRILGPGHPRVADALSNLANIHASLGEYDEARRIHLAALAIFERASGPRHPDVAVELGNLADLAEGRGAHDEAVAFAGRAAAIVEESLGPDSLELVPPLLALAKAHLARGADATAETHLLRARALQERAFGPDHPNLAQVHLGLGELHRVRGRIDDAAAAFERALAAYAARGEPEGEARARLSLADVLWTRESERPRALALAREAIALSGSSALAREAAAWLRVRAP